MGEPDLTEFLSLSKPKRPTCLLGLERQKLNESEREQLDAALATDQGLISNIAISKWLEHRDHNIGWQAVLSHRAGRCSCGRAA